MGQKNKLTFSFVYGYALKASLKICLLSYGLFLLIMVLAEVFRSQGLEVILIILVLFQWLVVFWLIYYICKLFFEFSYKNGFSPTVWLFLFMVINVVVIFLILIQTIMIIANVENGLDLLKGPIHVNFDFN